MTTTSAASSEEPTVTPPIQNPLFTLGIPPWGSMVELQRPLIATFEARVSEKPDFPFIGTRPEIDGKRSENFVFQTYSQVKERVRRLCNGMRKPPLCVEPGQHIAIIAPVMPEYLLISLACMALRVVLVHVNENSSPEILRYILEHSDSRAAFVSKRVAEGRVLTLAAGVLPTVICIEDQLSAIEESGSEGKWPDAPPRMDELAILMYTSGTTNKPKGVMITHGNLTAGIGSLVSNIPEPMLLSIPLLRYYNFLPLSHIYGVAVCYVFVRLGGTIGLFCGNRNEILAEIQAFKPNIIACVPRVLQRFYEGVTAKIASQSIVLRAAFWSAYALKRWSMSRGQGSPLADKIFAKVRAGFGGELKIILNGGAPIQRHIAEFFHIVVSPEFWIGYGMTETSATGLRTQPGDSFEQFGMLTPFFNSEIRIASIPSMGYLATDEPPRGELCIRGPFVSPGYFKDPEATAAAFDSDGFVHTGDVVVQDGHRVRIVDRIKGIIKLSQGEYISAESIEGALSQSPAIASSFVHGEPTSPFPVAIIVPSAEYFAKWCSENGNASISKDMAAVCKNQGVRKHIAAEIERVSRAAGLKGFEFVSNFHLHETPFDEARDLITSSMKLKRHVLRAYFREDLRRLCS